MSRDSSRRVPVRTGHIANALPLYSHSSTVMRFLLGALDSRFCRCVGDFTAGPEARKPLRHHRNTHALLGRVLSAALSEREAPAPSSGDMSAAATESVAAEPDEAEVAALQVVLDNSRRELEKVVCFVVLGPPPPAAPPPAPRPLNAACPPYLTSTFHPF